MNTAIFAGTFDPFSIGHLNLAKRAQKLCGRLVVAVYASPEKRTMFTLRERIELARAALPADIEVKSFSGLLTSFMRAEGAEILIRGIRNNADYTYEADLERVYKTLAPGIECVYLLADKTYISGTIIRNLLETDAPLDGFMPPAALPLIYGFYKNKK